MDGWLQTVSGALSIPEAGVLLPHEHLFLDLRGPEARGYAQADPEAVLATMRPYLQDLKQQGIVGLVECSTVGVGRNVRILSRLAEATGLAIIAPTGVYAESVAPAFLHAKSQRELETWMAQEIERTIEGTTVRAGFIKLASSPHGLSAFEERVLRAAARVACVADVAIASHTIKGVTALAQISILEEEGLPADRFVWAHAHMEPESAMHREAARRGAYVEFDNIGAHITGAANPFPEYVLADETALRLVDGMVNAGFVDRVLLSQDAGWYDAGRAGAGCLRGFTYLLDQFVPRLIAAGLEEAVGLIVERNPWRAFGRRASREWGEQS